MSEVEKEKPIDRSWPQFNEEKFIPQIADDLYSAKKGVHNCIAIEVDLSAESRLDFSEAMKKIEEINQTSFFIFFTINLNLIKTYESYFDEVIFESIRLGIKVFQEKILKPNISKVFGIGFNFGSLNDQFLQSPLAAVQFDQYLEGTYGDLVGKCRLTKEKNLFQVSLIAEYIHRISSSIQENIEIYAIFDFRKFSPLEILQFISLDRFSYIRIGLIGCVLPILGLNFKEGKMIGGTLGCDVLLEVEPEIGLIFPSDHKLMKDLEKDYEDLLYQLIDLKKPFYILYEETMTENWQNLEKVIVHSKFIDPILKRKCMGFAAADGSIVTYGESIGFFDEINFEYFKVSG